MVVCQNTDILQLYINLKVILVMIAMYKAFYIYLSFTHLSIKYYFIYLHYIWIDILKNVYSNLLFDKNIVRIDFINFYSK